MGKELKKTSKKTTTAKKSNNKKNENEVIIEELKSTAKNVKKEFSKAKDIIVKGIKNNTDNIPDELKNVKEKFSKKFVEAKDQIVDEVSKKVKKTDFEKSKEPKSKQTYNNHRLEKYKSKSNDILLFIKEKTDCFIAYIKKMDRKKLIIILVAIFAIIFVIPNIFNNKTKYNYDYDYVEELVIKYRVKVNIEFVENLLFSKYDVNLTSSNKTEKLKHGVDKTVEFHLEEGEHTITFTSDEDSDISNQFIINVTSNMEVGFKISCHYNEISVTKKYTDKDEEMINNEIKLKSDNSAYVNKNYKTVIKDLEKLGFTNIEEKPIYDIVFGFTDEGEVEKVKIDGKDNYKKGDVFKNDVKVVVSYHMNVNDDPSKIKPPYVTSTAKGKNYKDIVKAFEDAGFTNVKTIEIVNYSDKPKNTVSDIYAAGSTISKDKVYEPNVEIEIRYYGRVNYSGNNNDSSDELSLYDAKKAFEEYGEKLYPYGFKCHWIVDFKAKEQSEDGKTWYLKVGVTIENAFGNKREAVAEGIVSGNDNYQKVISFSVN